VEEAISYAVGHRIRVEILASLNEAVASASELAAAVHQPLSTVTHHIEELLKSGSIEVARTERVRNISQNFYRAVELPFFTDEEMEAMPPAARQEIYGVILQAVMAEALAAFWAGKSPLIRGLGSLGVGSTSTLRAAKTSRMSKRGLGRDCRRSRLSPPAGVPSPASMLSPSSSLLSVTNGVVMPLHHP
jgi:DNA-binding transcriptional ArsR family regulator